MPFLPDNFYLCLNCAIFTCAIFSLAIFTVPFFPLPFFPELFLPSTYTHRSVCGLIALPELSFQTLSMTGQGPIKLQIIDASWRFCRPSYNSKKVGVWEELISQREHSYMPYSTRREVILGSVREVSKAPKRNEKKGGSLCCVRNEMPTFVFVFGTKRK